MTRTARQKRIRRGVQERKKETPRADCPTPRKRAYTSEEAVHKALLASRRAGRSISIYWCKCETYHLTKIKQ